MNSGTLSARLSTPLGGFGKIAWGDLLLAAVLGSLGVASAMGWYGSNADSPHAGAAAAALVLLMTVPVGWVRRYPVVVAAVLGLGAIVNAVVIGALVRCGVALPAAFYAAFVIGWLCVGWWAAAVGTAALLVNLVCQSITDPRLGPSGLVYMAPILLACVGGGLALGSRQTAVGRLRQLTKELHEQREATARVAVAADRAQIATGLDGFLQDQMSRIGRAAAAGHAALPDRPDDAERAFVTIQAAGRLTLGRMRDIVADLSDDGVPDRQRLLAGLDRMLADATEGQASLRIVGEPWLLPPGVELSSFRIVEQLLPCLQPARPGLLEVTVTFGRQDLRLTVSGRPSRRTTARPALAAARRRTQSEGGTLGSTVSAGRRTVFVTLPVVANHV